jgi:hypothetical protein
MDLEELSKQFLGVASKPHLTHIFCIAALPEKYQLNAMIKMRFKKRTKSSQK